MKPNALIGRLPKPSRTWLVLSAALVVGLLAALGARRYLSNRIQQIEDQANSQKVQVVVAKVALHKGDVLSTDNLAVRSLPQAYAHGSAVRPDEFEHLEGERIGYDVGPGETILWALLEAKKAPTFSVRVAEGRRAITVPVDEINSISGLLEPGDIIDLVVSLERSGGKLAVPVVQAAKVMATGQRSVDDPKTGESRQYETVTLDLTPEQSRNLILARDSGRVTALLRNPTDTGGPGLEGDFAGLFKKSTATAGRAASREASRRIPVMYGGGGSSSASGTPDLQPADRLEPVNGSRVATRPTE